MRKEPKIERLNGQKEKFNVLKEKWEKVMEEEGMSFYEKCGEFATKLREKYPDYDKYQLYHLLGGSTFDEGDCPKFDFLGEDSIEEFLKKHIPEK